MKYHSCNEKNVYTIPVTCMHALYLFTLYNVSVILTLLEYFYQLIHYYIVSIIMSILMHEKTSITVAPPPPRAMAAVFFHLLHCDPFS